MLMKWNNLKFSMKLILTNFTTMKTNKVIYSLDIGDIQEVSNQELGRDLSPDEIEKVIEPIAEKIKWYDAIADAIAENITSEEDL